MSAFPGFPTETQAFLRELRQNNTREWFAANKARYDEVVKAPAVAWVASMGECLQQLDAELVVDLRTNGSGCLMRSARDTRFSKDKSPYKVNIAMLWWHGSGKKMQHPAFGMEITPEDAGLVAGMFHFPKPMLAAYRQAVLDEELGEQLLATVHAVCAHGYTISGRHYKRAPRGFDKQHPRADWLKYNSFHAGAHNISADTIASPRLIDVCMDQFEKLAPMHHWLVAVQEKYGGI
ncbi:MAG: DUF2461 domain-containing protein [Chloroflexi bacterium]|nr:DUF2461 domain-containing protein [Chloroflexota bacterium]